MTATTWTIARDTRTSDYAIHRDGCRHLIARHLEVHVTGRTGTAQEVADRFEAGNEGCWAVLGPCARG